LGSAAAKFSGSKVHPEAITKGDPENERPFAVISDWQVPLVSAPCP
jgi:hypothetical protein